MTASEVAPERRPTIRDISFQAGVSTFSVSQALAGKPGVSEQTRKLVLQIADDIGYVPNRLAANLKDAASTTVGVLAANGRNQYYAVLVQAIDAVLQDHGLHAVTNDAMRGDRYSAEAERSGVKELIQQRVAAIVATYSLCEDSLELLRRWRIPVVFVDSSPPPAAKGYSFVGVDNESASARVLDYLADLGHSRVAYLGYPPDWNTRIARERGFRSRAQQRGVGVEVWESDNSAGGAAARVGSELDGGSDVTAVFATNTLLLQGTLRELHRRGIRIPSRMSVIGFDDFDWAELVDPPLTVVDQHIDDLGRAAGETVAAAVRNGWRDAPSENAVVIPSTLIERSSCAAPYMGSRA